jgi:hypothetical protein
VRFWWVLGVFLTLNNGARADDASFGGDGATVFALKDNRVRMVSEHIVIKSAPEGRWQAECDFTFENLKKTPVDLQMGFPDWKGWEDAGGWLIEKFTVTVEGKLVTPLHKDTRKGMPALGQLQYEGAYVWPVTLAPRAKITVHNSYRFRGFSSNGPLNACTDKIPATLWRDVFWKKAKRPKGGWDYDDSLCNVVSYIVSTAKTWNGTIGEADIEIELDPRYSPHAIIFVPHATEVSQGRARWHFTNWSPKSDIFLIYLRPPNPENAVSGTPSFDTVEQIKAWREYARANHFDDAMIRKVVEMLPDLPAPLKAALRP